MLVTADTFREALYECSERYSCFRLVLLEQSMHIFPSEKRLWYLSAAHTEQDIARTVEAVDSALMALRDQSQTTEGE